jgi:hypothetical protein
VSHPQPFTLNNHTHDESTEILKKKKSVNEHYSFLLGKLDRSRSNLRSDRGSTQKLKTSLPDPYTNRVNALNHLGNQSVDYPPHTN